MSASLSAPAARSAARTRVWATPTSTPSRTAWAAHGSGWSATRPGPGLAPSPACWAAGSSWRRVAVVRPFAGWRCSPPAVHIGWWRATPLVMFAIFVAVVTVTHDVVHRALRLGPRGTEAYRLTHLQHHRRFPHPTDDPGGYPAGMSFLGAVCSGPVFLIRLWWWAWRTGRDRAWPAVEACVPILALAAGILSLPRFPGILVYVTMAIAGSGVYPLLTVYLPHHDYGDTPLSQTRTLRGCILPAVFLELTYRLEHHLYPQVPSHNLPELGRRLDPHFAASGVKPVRVP